MTVSITHLLNRTVVVQRRSLASDGQGGSSHAFATHATTIGRRQPAGSKDRLVGEREEAEVTHVWFMDKGHTGYKRGDRFVSNGIVDEVVAYVPPSRDDFVKYVVKEIQLGATV